MLASIRNFGLAVLTTFVVMGLGGVWLLIAANAAGWSGTFWLGFAFVFAIIVAIGGAAWASHPSTKVWPGTLIGLVIMTAAFVVGSVARPFDNFVWGDLWWGILDMVIIMIAAALVYTYARVVFKRP